MVTDRVDVVKIPREVVKQLTERVSHTARMAKVELKGFAAAAAGLS
jgi:hypothetical protein